MDLRDLINKLNTIEQENLLDEAEELMEKVRIRYSDVEAVANQYKDDEGARLAALTKLIKDNNLPGLFDPIKKELVKPDGTYAWMAGADEATVNRLERFGLLPDGAKTSSWLGSRGKDQAASMAGNKDARSRDQMVDRAAELMKKAVTSATAAPVSESISTSLLESFGITTQLLEAITAEEHKELKDLVKKLEPFAKEDPDSADLVAQFRAYNEKRDALIERIRALIETLKANSSTTTPNTARPISESLNESKQRMIAEGRVVVLENNRYLRDGIEWTFNPQTSMYSTVLESGETVQLDEQGFWQGAGDLGRGAASGATMGYSDNIVAGAKSLLKGTKYADELKRELATTDAVKKRSPMLYGAGELAGFVGISTLLPGAATLKGALVGGAALGAVKYGSDKLVREPHNADTVAQATGGNTPTPNGAPGRQGTGQQPKDPKVLALQQQLIKLYGPTILPRHGADGRMGPETQKAIDRAKADGKLPATAATANTTAPAATVSSNELSSGKVQSAINALGLKTGSTVGPEMLIKLAGSLGIEQAPAPTASTTQPAPSMAESIMSLRDRLQQIEESNQLNENLFARFGAEVIELVATKLGPEIARLAATNVSSAAARLLPAAERAAIASAKRQAASIQSQMTAGAGKAAGVADDVAASAVKAAEVAAPKGTESVVTALTTKLGPKAGTALEKVKGLGGRLGGWIRNHKFLSLIALLGVLGYIITDNDDEVNPNVVTPTGPVNPPVNPQPAPNTDPKQDEDKKRQIDELSKLLAQLYDGWPTDTETNGAIDLGTMVGGKDPRTGGRTGSGQQPVSGSTAAFPNVVGQRRADRDANMASAGN